MEVLHSHTTLSSRPTFLRKTAIENVRHLISSYEEKRRTLEQRLSDEFQPQSMDTLITETDVRGTNQTTFATNDMDRGTISKVSSKGVRSPPASNPMSKINKQSSISSESSTEESGGSRYINVCERQVLKEEKDVECHVEAENVEKRKKTPLKSVTVCESFSSPRPASTKQSLTEAIPPKVESNLYFNRSENRNIISITRGSVPLGQFNNTVEQASRQTHPLGGKPALTIIERTPSSHLINPHGSLAVKNNSQNVTSSRNMQIDCERAFEPAIKFLSPPQSPNMSRFTFSPSALSEKSSKPVFSPERNSSSDWRKNAYNQKSPRKMEKMMTVPSQTEPSEEYLSLEVVDLPFTVELTPSPPVVSTVPTQIVKKEIEVVPGNAKILPRESCPAIEPHHHYHHPHHDHGHQTLTGKSHMYHVDQEPAYGSPVKFEYAKERGSTATKCQGVADMFCCSCSSNQNVPLQRCTQEIGISVQTDLPPIEAITIPKDLCVPPSKEVFIPIVYPERSSRQIRPDAVFLAVPAVTSCVDYVDSQPNKADAGSAIPIQMPSSTSSIPIVDPESVSESEESDSDCSVCQHSFSHNILTRSPYNPLTTLLKSKQPGTTTFLSTGVQSSSKAPTIFNNDFEKLLRDLSLSVQPKLPGDSSQTGAQSPSSNDFTPAISKKAQDPPSISSSAFKEEAEVVAHVSQKVQAAYRSDPEIKTTPKTQAAASSQSTKPAGPPNVNQSSIIQQTSNALSDKSKQPPSWRMDPGLMKQAQANTLPGNSTTTSENITKQEAESQPTSPAILSSGAQGTVFRDRLNQLETMMNSLQNPQSKSSNVKTLEPSALPPPGLFSVERKPQMVKDDSVRKITGPEDTRKPQAVSNQECEDDDVIRPVANSLVQNSRIAAARQKIAVREAEAGNVGNIGQQIKPENLVATTLPRMASNEKRPISMLNDPVLKKEAEDDPPQIVYATTAPTNMVEEPRSMEIRSYSPTPFVRIKSPEMIWPKTDLSGPTADILSGPNAYAPSAKKYSESMTSKPPPMPQPRNIPSAMEAGNYFPISQPIPSQTFSYDAPDSRMSSEYFPQSFSPRYQEPQTHFNSQTQLASNQVNVNDIPSFYNSSVGADSNNVTFPPQYYEYNGVPINSSPFYTFPRQVPISNAVQGNGNNFGTMQVLPQNTIQSPTFNGAYPTGLSKKYPPPLVSSRPPEEQAALIRALPKKRWPEDKPKAANIQPRNEGPPSRLMSSTVPNAPPSNPLTRKFESNDAIPRAYASPSSGSKMRMPAAPAQSTSMYQLPNDPTWSQPIARPFKRDGGQELYQDDFIPVATAKRRNMGLNRSDNFLNANTNAAAGRMPSTNYSSNYPPPTFSPNNQRSQNYFQQGQRQYALK